MVRNPAYLRWAASTQRPAASAALDDLPASLHASGAPCLRLVPARSGPKSTVCLFSYHALNPHICYTCERICAA